MPILQNPRHEFFAQARARGARLYDAYEDAGFAPDRGHASRLAAEPAVAERIAELLAEQTGPDMASAPEVIRSLLGLAKESLDLAHPAAVKEARLALLDALRIQEGLDYQRSVDRSDIIKVCLTKRAAPGRTT